MNTEEIMREVPGAMHIRRCPEMGGDVVEFYYKPIPSSSKSAFPLRALRFKRTTLAQFFSNGDIRFKRPPRFEGINDSIRFFTILLLLTMRRLWPFCKMAKR